MIFFLCSWITKIYDYYGSLYQSAERNKMLADKTAEEHIRPKGSCMFYWDDPVHPLKKDNHRSLQEKSLVTSNFNNERKSRQSFPCRSKDFNATSSTVRRHSSAYEKNTRQNGNLA